MADLLNTPHTSQAPPEDQLAPSVQFPDTRESPDFSSALKNSSKISLEEAASIPLFADLPPEALEKVREVLYRQVANEGETLLHERDRGDAILFLLSGSVKILVESQAGPCILGFCGAGDMLGELAVIDGLGRSACAVAQTSCQYALVSRFDFWHTIWAIQPIPYTLARLMSDRVRRLSSQLQSMATLDVTARLARQMVMLVEEHGQPRGTDLVIPFEISQNELGQMVGATRVQVNRTIAAWKSEELVSLHRSQIVVHNIKRLRRMAIFDEQTAARRPTKTR